MRMNPFAYALTFTPVVLLLILLPMPHLGIVLLPILMLVQFAALLFTIVNGKERNDFRQGTKPLLWVNGIALAIYPVLLLLVFYTVGTALDGIEP